MKILLCFLVMGISVFAGRVLSEKYRRKERFYFDLVTFCTSFRVNLGYRRETVWEVFRQNPYQKDFSEYAQSMLGRSDEAASAQDGRAKETPAGHAGETRVLKSLMISEQEATYIDNFFRCLGKNDAESQSKEIEFYSKYFEKKLTEAQENARQKSPMAMKLSVLAGFLVCIMLI